MFLINFECQIFETPNGILYCFSKVLNVKFLKPQTVFCIVSQKLRKIKFWIKNTTKKSEIVKIIQRQVYINIYTRYNYTNKWSNEPSSMMEYNIPRQWWMSLEPWMQFFAVSFFLALQDIEAVSLYRTLSA
mgnify:CR=1 FL=1